MNDPNVIRVLVVDDHTVVRRGLIFVMQNYEDIQVVGEAGSIEEAVRQSESLAPNVVLMDIKMVGGRDGILATQIIHGRFPEIRVLILSSFYEPELVTQAMQAGAKGYLLKDISTDELARAIRLANAGKLALSPEAAEALVHLQQTTDPNDRDLTGRQIEVLSLLVEGLTNSEIAERLNITTYTARHHVSEILSRLQASNRAEAAAIAVKKGLIKR